MNNATSPLTKTEQVLDVLRAGGRISQKRGGVFVLRDRTCQEVPAWQNAIKAAAKIALAKPTEESKEHSMQVLNLALRIADASVRSEVECFAYWKIHSHRTLYDTSKVIDEERGTPEGNAESLRRVADAVRYIDLRGDAFPWRMVRDLSFPNIVHFESKER